MDKKIGLIINPIAGIGGAVGLKGSDGEDIQKLALERGAIKKSAAKARIVLESLLPYVKTVCVYAAPGEMGAALAEDMGFNTVVVGTTENITFGKDTEAIAKQLAGIPVDILLFAGGDGTARNICGGVPQGFPVIGIPAGVKIHSAAYATTPVAAGKALLAALGSFPSYAPAEVLDIDEEAYRAGFLKTQLYGYLSVPHIRGLMQNPKAASHLGSHDVSGICHEIEERMVQEANPQTAYIIGAGSTTNTILHHLGLEGTLLGIDVLQNGSLVARDANETALLSITRNTPCKLIITAIGGQGHIFGRGNQQLSPAVIRNIGLDNIWVVATASKVFSLTDQTLHVDTGDSTLNAELAGYKKVIVGYQETLVCRVT